MKLQTVAGQQGVFRGFGTTTGQLRRKPIAFTEDAIAALSSPVKREVQDAKFPGLSLMVMPSGTKTFYLRYRVNGKRHRVKLGAYGRMEEGKLTLKQAREGAIELKRSGQRGKTPPSLRGATFKQVADKFIAWAKEGTPPNLATWRDYEGKIETSFKPLHNRPIAAIKRGELLALLENKTNLRDESQGVSASTKNNLASTMSTIFRWAMRYGKVDLEYNPAAELPREVPTAGEKVLTDAEIKRFWNHPFPENTGRALRALLLTAQRSTALLGMRRSEIKDGNRWIVPKERMKGRKGKRVPNLVPLSRLALKTIDLESVDGDLIFPGRPRGAGKGTSAPIISTSLTHLIAKEGFDWTPRDLRRTASTIMGSLKVNRAIISLILGHCPPGVTAKHYNLYDYEDEKRAALETLARYVAGLVR